MRTASWILLAIAGAVTLLGALASARVAYAQGQEQIGPVSLTDLAANREEVLAALRGRRGTAAAYAAAYGVLFLLVAVGPYRRGDVSSWWGLLASALVLLLLTVARIPFLGMSVGSGTAVAFFVLVLIGLLLDVGRLRRPAASAAP